MKTLRSGAMVAVFALVGCGQGSDPTPTSNAPRPGFASWLSPLVGQSMAAAFPKPLDCKGFVDIVTQHYTGNPGGSQIQGWSWDAKVGQPFDRILFTVDGKIVGGGHGGRARPDVPKTLPDVHSMTTGWEGEATATSGTLMAWGFDPANQGSCLLGEIKL